jgi:hypothetical protein
LFPEQLVNKIAIKKINKILMNDYLLDKEN